ncbi:MAG TPA: tetratricopeptide repeat protein [Pyrinomonadaceae bacterium]|nr:tetratricopeptide repeat protein [Pyrinomonadaceae bacterium]
MRRPPALAGFSVAFILILASLADGAQEAEFARGRIIEKVVCKANAEQSYALYLPSGYTPEKRWPILYAFAPDAQGRIPVERFQEAAEKYGWIVAGSLVSKNGSIQKSVDATKALWEDTHARFRIDDKRVYTTGFSGGARVAAWAAYLCDGCVAGVIGHGAGFHEQITPTASTPASSIHFIFYGTIGTDDFNFGELRNLDQVLNLIKIPHRVAVFEGRHQWAPKEICTRAVEWMELQAIKAGTRPRDEALVEELWKRSVEAAQRAESEQTGYDAYVAYNALAEDFRGLRDVSEFERRAARLKETAEVRKAIKEDKEQIKRQQMLEGELRAYQEKRKDLEQRAQAHADFTRVLGDLRKKSKEPADSIERRIARRTLNGLFAFYFESAMSIIERRKDYAAAVFNLEAAAEIAQNNPYIMYELANAYALNGEKKRALEALRRAVEKGFTDLALLNSSEALEPLRKEPEYQKIVESIRQKP